MGDKLLLIGGGGHCSSVIDSVLSLGDYEEIGIIDKKGKELLNIPVIGGDSDLERLYSEGWKKAFISVGSIGDTSVRKKIYENIKKIGFEIETIIDPTAVISAGCEINEGTFVGKNAIVNSGSKIGACSIINTGSIVEHDCVIGSFSHISSGAVICGGVIVGDNTHIGAGSVVIQGLNIGSDCLIGAGSVVVKDIATGKKAFGNPCKVNENERLHNC